MPQNDLAMLFFKRAPRNLRHDEYAHKKYVLYLRSKRSEMNGNEHYPPQMVSLAIEDPFKYFGMNPVE